MTADFRDRINACRFLLIVGLVFLHFGAYPGSEVSPFRGMQSGGYALATFVNSFFLFFFLSAVPLLSAISGYLFFREADYSRGFFVKRWKSRAQSILLPMISWNLLALLLFTAIAWLDPASSLLGIVKYDVRSMDLRDLVNALLGIRRHPIIFQFWFLRDLLLTILLTPVLALLLRRIPWLGLAGLFLVWMTDSDLGIFFRTDVLFFFYAGALLQVRGKTPPVLAPNVALWTLAAYVILVACRTAAPLVVPESSGVGTILYGPGAKLLRVLGVVVAWNVAPLILRGRIGPALLFVAPSAFFLHAIHWPMNQFVKVAVAHILGSDSNPALVAIYLVTVAVTIALSLAVAMGLSRFTPALFKHLSGGRLLPTASARPQIQTDATSGRPGQPYNRYG